MSEVEDGMEDFGIKGELGKYYILKREPSIERRYGNYGNSETMTRKNESWKRKSKEKTNKEKNWNLAVGVHDMSEISGTELEKYDTNP